MHQEYAVLCEEIPHPKCALNFSNPFELLVATVLSAQTTDKRVNMGTPELFGEYPGPAALASANPEHVESIIHSIGFHHTKAKNIIGLSYALCERFDGEVPQTMDALTSLPGVGRKTANVVLPRPQSHRTRDHRLLPARRVDGPVSQADIAWSCHMPCAQARLPQLPP